MSIGLTVHCQTDDTIGDSMYCQEIATAFGAGLFRVLKEQGHSNLIDCIIDDEGDWSEQIAKLPDPLNPKPEEIAEIAANLYKSTPASVIRDEAEKALDAIKAIDDSQFDGRLNSMGLLLRPKKFLIQDFEENFLPVLAEADDDDELKLIVA